MSAKTESSGKSAISKQENQATYEIGKIKAIVTRVFREDDGKSLDEILVSLIKKEFEKT